MLHIQLLIHIHQHVKGYYDYAFPRFVEHVCQSVACELFVKCRNALKGSLEQELGVMGPDCKSLTILLFGRSIINFSKHMNAVRFS